MNLRDTLLAGTCVLATCVFAQGALANSSIEVIGDENRDVHVTIERVDGDGQTIITERNGGGYTIQDSSEAGRLVRVELVEDDEDGNAQTRVCIVNDNNHMECSGEPLRTLRILRERRQAERAAEREMHHAEMAENRADMMRARRDEMEDARRLHEEERAEHRERMRVHVAELGDRHGRHHAPRADAVSERELVRLDAEVSRLRSELRSLQRRLDRLNNQERDHSSLGEIHENVYVWSSADDSLHQDENVHVEIIDGELTINDEVIIDLTDVHEEHASGDGNERQFVWRDENDDSITISKTIEIIIDDNEVVDLEFGSTDDQDVVIDVDVSENETVTIIDLKGNSKQP